MLPQYHIEITLAALGARFSARAMSAIIQANVNQDRIAGQFGHDEFHFDNNAFERTYTYIENQRAIVISSLNAGDTNSAWQAFGRFLHSAQDFYAHSNYITMWVSLFDGQPLPPPPEVDPLDSSLIDNPNLRSGRIYYPFELLYFPRATRAFALRILPKDSHAWMNLDTPEQGFKFDYAMHAAIKRTAIEFEKTAEEFPEKLCKLFLDR